MEEVHIIRITPEQFGYEDRGIVKWLGMLLSDHTEALKQERKKNQLREIKAKVEMTEVEKANILYKAFTTGSPVLIQANIVTNGNYYKDLACKVSGYADNQIYFILKDKREASCTLEEIRNVEFMNLLDWYDKRE
ncbi:hypothetical protein AB4Y30_08925 [Ornithinibacillus sp. 4-3]|uniref:YolD-like family protein n=1 Tax=Ornithinibacillus sp. 4-3 TaxID=3231488 RepID=A0AB39HXI0_9BACI